MSTLLRQMSVKSSIGGFVVIAVLLGLATVGHAVCSNPNFPVDCHDDFCCPVGNTCNALNSQICCPGEFPVQCQSTCCHAGHQCGPGGASCISPTPCSDPNFPVNCNGTLCCPPSNTCNTLNGQLCCPPGFPISCLNACCSAGHQCGPGGATCVSSPVGTCLPGQCDDGEACTVDTCTDSGCHQEPASGHDAVCSDCRGGLGSQACAGQPLPAAVGQRLTLACTLRDQAGTKTLKAAQKLLRRATKSLKNAGALVRRAAKRHKGAISVACANQIAGVLHGHF